MPSSLQPGTGIAGARAALLPRPQPLHTSRTQRMARTARRGITTVMLAGLDALRQRQRAGTFRLIFVSSWAKTLMGWKRDSPPSLFSLTSSEHQAYKAVSYTHLRAHETRHDLVCRLLLEKKKKQ